MPSKPSKTSIFIFMADKTKRNSLWHSGALAGITLGLGLYFYAPLVEAPLYLFTTNVDAVSKKIYDHPTEDSWLLWLSRLSHAFHDRINFAALELASVQNFANPIIKVVYIPNGMRKEQIVEKVGRVLAWGPENKKVFLKTEAPTTIGQLEDGYFYPGFYSFRIGTTGREAASEMINRFQKEVLRRYPESTNELVPVSTALVVASLIEREAADRTDMPLVAGVIWNRIFANMPLGIDATLQYAHGTNANRWWPRVRPNDKFVKSPYNTYKEAGLPPGPIANPGLASIEAALNPIPTDCFYYLHDKDREFRCARTYDEHKENIERYY